MSCPTKDRRTIRTIAREGKRTLVSVCKVKNGPRVASVHIATPAAWAVATYDEEDLDRLIEALERAREEISRSSTQVICRRAPSFGKRIAP